MPAEPVVVAHALQEAAQFVLETMFFAESEPIPAPAGPPAEAQVAVGISFDGARRGSLSIGMPESCARAMAGSFEGVPDPELLPAANVGQVAGELANMICGATLARLDPDGLFNLGSPALQAQFSPVAAPASECWLQIPYMGEGLLHLALALEDRP